MRSLAALGLLLCLFSLPVRGGGNETGDRQEILDAPGGKAVAVLLPGGAALATGEKRDGYIQVAVVGWIRDQGRPLAEESGPVPAPLGATAPGPVLSGVIAVSLASGEVRYGSGASVAVLGPREELDESWNALRANLEKDSSALDARIEDLKAKEKAALSSTDNLTQASQNLDATRKLLRDATREKQALGESYAARAEGLLNSYRVAETVADSEGHYSFSSLSPGSYRLLAVLTLGDGVRRWFLPVDVKEEAVRKDLGSGETGPDPYFGSR
jgi:hypothetical protein